ncbi:MAG: RNA polymerase subunit sigma-24 [Acidobacteria bacterium]|nr:MAG: RNA polymerase subunit sigma-24 [Acidobacteriota bacterium]
MGLGTVPDFEPLQVFPSEAWSSTEDPEKKVNLFSEPVRLKDQGVVYETEALHDEDANLVAQAKKGDLDAFEQLVRLHQGRVYRTLIFMTQNSSEAEDGMQDVFLRVFESIGGFQGTARFSTWLTRIAINEGVERLRKRREMESLDEESADEDEPFRPRYVVSWEDNPEQLYSKAEIRQLVQGELMKIPIKYRVPVLLRDLEQLSTEEAAQALDLAVPALKSRLLRGRLMLREALAPNFKKRAAGV